MIIGIDASRTAKQFKTGTETYSTELIKALAKIDRQNEYILYSPTSLLEKLPNLPQNFKSKILPFGRLWTQLRLSWEFLTSDQPDVFFVPAHTLPLVMPKKSVVTVHDLGFKHYPELYSPTDLKYHNWALGHSVKNATQIIAISEFTKRDLLKYFQIQASKISVIYEGYDEQSFCPTPQKKTAKPYLLFIGRLEEKKNIVGMLRAYEILRRNKTFNHQFILAGNPGFGYEKIEAELAKMPPAIRKDVILPGYISQEKYVDLLKNAEVLFFATFFEGFGLPPLEAMASGVPVVASNRTSIPEICDEAALLVDPEKPDKMAGALKKVIDDENLRHELIAKGLNRAKMFSWEKCAEKTLETFKLVYNRK